MAVNVYSTSVMTYRLSRHDMLASVYDLATPKLRKCAQVPHTASSWTCSFPDLSPWRKSSSRPISNTSTSRTSSSYKRLSRGWTWTRLCQAVFRTTLNHYLSCNWSHVFSTSRGVSSIQRWLIRTVNCDVNRETKATWCHKHKKKFQQVL